MLITIKNKIMPKITKKYYKVLEQDMMMEVYYNTTNGFYFKRNDTIDSMVRTVEFSNVASTEDQLYIEMRDKLEEYHTLMTKCRRVIALEYKVGKQVSMTKTGPGHYSGKQGFHNVGHMELDFGIGFDYRVLIEKKGREKVYHAIDESGKVGYTTRVTKEEVIMDWTQEREDTLIGLAVSANAMALKFHKFMASEDLPNLLQSGNVKLIE